MSKGGRLEGQAPTRRAWECCPTERLAGMGTHALQRKRGQAWGPALAIMRVLVF